MPEVERVALGAACAIFDSSDRILLVRHTYGRLNWELPGGFSDTGETPEETAERELLEETGLIATPDRLTGVYLEPGHDFGPMLHFVFRFTWRDGFAPVASSDEIADVASWPLDDLPKPISDFTERRIRDALGTGPLRVPRIARRQWRE